jgi:hypothetical protein
MNLLCPNCQKMLTVPEQYAGQLMKCPLCAGTFTVPGLPASTPAAPPPSPPTYPVQPEAPATSPTSAVTGSPSSSTAPPSAATAPTSAFTGTPPPPSLPGGPFTFSIRLKPEVVQWIAPGALLFAFILMLFFPWIGVYPGGQAVAWQYAWEMPFGVPLSQDPDLQKHPELRKQFHYTDAKELAEGSEPKDNRPGVDLLMLFYWPLFLLTLLVTVGCALLPVLQLKLPPNLDPVLQWRWGIVAILNLLTFLVLCVHLIWGFSMEHTIYAWKMAQPDIVDLARNDNRDTIQNKTLAALKGEAANLVQRTIYLKLTVLLEIIAIGAAALMMELERRGNRPVPHLDLVV